MRIRRCSAGLSAVLPSGVFRRLVPPYDGAQDEARAINRRRRSPQMPSSLNRDGVVPSGESRSTRRGPARCIDVTASSRVRDAFATAPDSRRCWHFGAKIWASSAVMVMKRRRRGAPPRGHPVDEEPDRTRGNHSRRRGGQVSSDPRRSSDGWRHPRSVNVIVSQGAGAARPAGRGS